uniref:Uncharacterized protein n=1 Tax=Nicotiana tabacum TaxID=4097 RepID=A0A1S3ZFC7_TOBAC|nr:PREDICTED: uncharacterized protein LOC107786058 [Nicotiana tabacum]
MEFLFDFGIILTAVGSLLGMKLEVDCIGICLQQEKVAGCKLCVLRKRLVLERLSRESAQVPIDRSSVLQVGYQLSGRYWYTPFAPELVVWLVSFRQVLISMSGPCLGLMTFMYS